MGKFPGAERVQRRTTVRRLPPAPVAARTADRRAILDAAHRVLLDGGTGGLTLAAVAREAQVGTPALTRLFGGRRGLIEALLDRLYADPAGDLGKVTAARPARERWRAYLTQVRQAHADRAATRAYFDLAALALRDPALGARLGKLDGEATRALGSVLGAGPDALAALVLAAVDGIELHRALAGDDYPADHVLDLLERLVLPELG